MVSTPLPKKRIFTLKAEGELLGKAWHCMAEAKQGLMKDTCWICLSGHEADYREGRAWEKRPKGRQAAAQTNESLR